MKKWMKGLAITGTVLLFTGVGICVFAGAAGGAHFSENNYWGSSQDFFEENELVSSRENMNLAASFNGVRRLELDIENAAVRVVENSELEDEIRFYIREKRGSRLEQRVEDGGDEVSVTYASTAHLLNRNFARGSHAEGIVEIPVGCKFEEVSIDVEAGETRVDFLGADKLLVDVGAGACTVENFDADVLELDVQAGEIKAKGNVNSKLLVDVGVGAAELSLAAKQEDFSYNLECGMGSVKFGTATYDGFAMEKSVDNGGSKKADLSCNMGEIEVEFYE